MLKIAVVGGGPAGLLFAKLAKRAEPAHAIDVFEQNPADATYGFGVVLADVALDILDGVDPELRQRISAIAEDQDRIAIVHKGIEINLKGNGFLGISRVKLLQLMQQNARDRAFNSASATVSPSPPNSMITISLSGLTV